MRKVVAAEFLSLDGVMESPDKWHFPYFNKEMGQAVGELCHRRRHADGEGELRGMGRLLARAGS